MLIHKLSHIHLNKQILQLWHNNYSYRHDQTLKSTYLILKLKRLPVRLGREPCTMSHNYYYITELEKYGQLNLAGKLPAGLRLSVTRSWPQVSGKPLICQIMIYQ